MSEDLTSPAIVEYGRRVVPFLRENKAAIDCVPSTWGMKTHLTNELIEFVTRGANVHEDVLLQWLDEAEVTRGEPVRHANGYGFHSDSRWTPEHVRGLIRQYRKRGDLFALGHIGSLETDADKIRDAVADFLATHEAPTSSDVNAHVAAVGLHDPQGVHGKAALEALGYRQKMIRTPDGKKRVWVRANEGADEPAEAAAE